jgi:hypothetical protein
MQWYKLPRVIECDHEFAAVSTATDMGTFEMEAVEADGQRHGRLIDSSIHSILRLLLIKEDYY